MTTITQQNSAIEQKSAPPKTAGDQAATRTSVSGIVDARGNQAFVRVLGYRRSPFDSYLPPVCLREFGLRTGDRIEGTARPRTASSGSAARSGAKSGRDRASAAEPAGTAIDHVATINGRPARQVVARPSFEDLTPLHPRERLRLGTGQAPPAARIVDLVSPIGKGQRGLIVSPPRAGKTMLLASLGSAIAAEHPEVHLMTVLIGERPEEVTDLRRSMRGEVSYSTFDQSAEDHIMVAELAIEHAKRLAELGTDVVVLLDSITRLGRAYNLAAPASSRTLAGGVATTALQPPRQFLGAARNLEEGGSVTILATALVDTGSRMDDLLFEEFKGTGNLEVRLRRDLADKRVFPAIDIAPTGTRREELLLSPAEYAATASLRRALLALDAQQAIELLLEKISQTPSNQDFLHEIQAQSPHHRAA